MTMGPAGHCIIRHLVITIQTISVSMLKARLSAPSRLVSASRKICPIAAAIACRASAALPTQFQAAGLPAASRCQDYNRLLCGSRTLIQARASSMASVDETVPPKTVLVPVAHGTEEMEAVIVIDVLRRAGADVVVASVEDTLIVNCSRQVKLQADESITTAVRRSYDLIALPGGMPGAERLRDCGPLEQLLRDHMSSGKHYAAICATPAVFFAAKGLIKAGQKATAHPAFADKLEEQSAVNDRVVIDGKMTTSRGPGTAFEFALSLVKQLYGEDKLKAVAGPMVMYQHSV